jgi:hypothetical protein
MKTLRIVSIAGALALTAPAFAQTLDHLACYKVKDPVAKGSFTVTVTNAAVSSKCTVKTPARFACFESEAAGFSPTPPGTPVTPGAARNFICYTAKCPKPFPADTQMSDEVGGQRVIRFKMTTLLCSPASRGPVIFQTTSTTIAGATTTTIPNQTCRFDSSNHTCVGTCAQNGFACSAVVGSGDCECRGTPCGDADQPSCDGFCKPDEACVFELTGCKCASIP